MKSNRKKDTYYERNKEKVLQKARKTYKVKRTIILKRAKKYRAKHKVQINRKQRIRYKRTKNLVLKKAKIHYQENKKKIIRKARKYRNKNKQSIAKRRRKKYVENKIKILKRNSKYQSLRSKTDPLFRIKRNLRRRMAQVLKRGTKKGSAIKDLGCTADFLKKYLENQFYSGMTWDNYGKFWIIDHKKALCFFDLTDREQFLKAVNYKNLKPLTIEDHVKKTSKDIEKLVRMRRQKL